MISSGPSQAGSNGTISGFVIDKETQNRLPGASVVIEGTNFGAMADKFGYFIIYNVPVGVHSLRASMIGYVPMRMTEVVVKTDLNTTVSFVLNSQILSLPEEIVVTSPRIQILHDVLSSTHYLGENTISTAIPAQTFYDALPLVPGYVSNRIRGGRNTSVQFLIDGLPANAPVTRQMAFMVPTSAIAEMVVQTGGFSAEYGNVTSGMVNLVTKEGRNDFHSSFKLAGDVPDANGNGSDRARRAEFAIGGPFSMRFGRPGFDGNYLLSGTLHVTDTPHGEQLRRAFNTPLFYNYDLNSKLTFRLSNNLYLRSQALFSNWEWREYDDHWEGRESAIPKRLNKNNRLSVSLTHTVSPRMFYQIELSLMDLRRRVLGEIPEGLERNYEVEAGHILAETWPGELEPWHEEMRERQLTARWSLVRQLTPVHQIKFGLEANHWDLSMDRARFLLWPDGNLSDPDYVYSFYQDAVDEQPYAIAGYVHHKIELSNFLATLGLRYEGFSPNSVPTPLPSEQTVAVNDSIFKPRNDYQRTKHSLAPRIGLAIPLSNFEQIAFNYGWFYELPPFYYLYVNKEGNVTAHWPIFGNVDLKPIRSTSWEIAYRRSIGDRSVLSLTVFSRKYQDLLDTALHEYTSDESGKNAALIFRYENRAEASSRGFEFAFRQHFGRSFTGGLSYTLMTSTGSASWPESGFLNVSRNFNEADSRTPLAWDQRHTFSMNLSYESSKGHALNLLSKIKGPATAVDWLTNERTRLGWRHYLDMRVTLPFSGLGFKLYPFLEIRNLLDVRSAELDEDGLDFGQPSLPFEELRGRRIWVGASYNID